MQPSRLRDYKEGGSYDFFIEHGDKKILIRPSFNYIEGQLDGIMADVLFLGVAGLAKADADKAVFDGTSYVLKPGISRKKEMVPAITNVLEAKPKE